METQYKTLVEKYAPRLKVAEAYYSANHDGKKLDKQRALVTAVMLENVNKYLTEQFENTIGTQRANMGAWKKFTIALTNIAVPNLIAFDLVYVYPMTSFSGYIAYVNYSYGTTKGSTTAGTVINNPFKLGNVDVNYTSNIVGNEAKPSTSALGAASGTLLWVPLTKGKVDFIVGAVEIKDNGEGKLFQGTTEVGTIDYKTGAYSFTATGIAAVTTVVANYSYDNEFVPQKDLPTISAGFEGISLQAKIRRIAILYSQIAAYQAKQDYQMSLEEQLADKAVGELSYEVDTEITNLLVDSAPADDDLVWSMTPLIGVSVQEHYASFVQVIEKARQKVYKRTKRYNPNYMLVSPDLIPVLTMIPTFNRSNDSTFNGPYFVGTLPGLKVYVTPNITDGHFVLGVNGGSVETSAAVYAPLKQVA